MTRRVKSLATAAEPVLEIGGTGAKIWKVNGRLHREDGPAVEWDDGSKMWYLHGQLHRENGPATEWPDGSKDWYRHGQLHREEGPAAEWASGTKKWCLNGQQYTKSAWLHELLKDRPLTTRQRELLCALSENWDGTPELLYETVTHLTE